VRQRDGYLGVVDLVLIHELLSGARGEHAEGMPLPRRNIIEQALREALERHIDTGGVEAELHLFSARPQTRPVGLETSLPRPFAAHTSH